MGGLIGGYWRAGRWRAWVVLAVTVGLTIGIVAINVVLSAWTAELYNVLQDRRQELFSGLLVRFAILAAALIAMAVYKLYLSQWLQIDWRAWLTGRYLGDWLAGGAYYRLQLLEGETDNPDQRIADDLRLFVEATVTLGLGLLTSVATLVAFVVILWRLSGAVTVPLPVPGGPVPIPGYLVWCALLYAAAGTWLAHRIGQPLAALEFRQQRAEADFRFALVRLREHAEAVALSRGEAAEQERFGRRFGEVVENFRRIMRKQKELSWFTSGYAQLAVVFPVLVTAPRYFSGDVPLGELIQTSVAFGQVQVALSWAVEAYPRLAAWKATVDRLVGFTRAVREVQGAVAAGQRVDGPGPGLSLDGLSMTLPGGRPLLADASLALAPGDHLLVSGPSGRGKTTLFRVLAGIWPYWRGRVTVPRGARLLFLPQRPYLPLGSLKAALTYPAPADSVTDEGAGQALTDVGLGHLAGELHREALWGQSLSGGEQQRVALARALLNRPDWLFLDEATSALPPESQASLYGRLRERLPATTLVSIAHGPDLAPFHPRRLDLPAASP